MTVTFEQGRLNWDVDITRLPKGHTRKRLNITPDTDEGLGVLRNTLGTRAITASVIDYGDILSTSVVTGTALTSPSRVSYTFGSMAAIAEIDITTSTRTHEIFASSLTGASLKAAIDKIDDNDIYSVVAGTYTVTVTLLVVPGNDSMSITYKTFSAATYPTISATSYTILGAEFDNETNRIYFFLRNVSVNTLSIYAYDINSGYYIHITPSSVLSASADKEINDIHFIGQGIDRLIGWCDTSSHRLNIYRSRHGDTFTDTVIDVSKEVPFLEYTDSTSSSDELSVITQYESYDILMRYVFDDGEKSAWGNYFGNVHNDWHTSIGSQQAILKTQHRFSFTGIPTNVKQIDFAVKDSTGEWKVVEAKDITETYLLTLPIDVPTFSIDNKELYKLFESVPLRNTCQTILNNNRLVVGDIVDGYPPTTLDVTFTDNPLNETARLYDTTHYTAPGLPSGTTKIVTLSGYVSRCLFLKTRNDTYKITLGDSLGSPASPVLPNKWFADYINNNITDSDLGTATYTANDFTVVFTSAEATTASVVTLTGWSAYNPANTLKTNALHYYGMSYYDKGAKCGHVNINDMTHQVDQYYYTYDSDNYTEALGLSVSIDHVPAEFSERYRFFYGGTDIQKYQQLVVKDTDISHFNGQTRIFLNDSYSGMIEFNQAVNFGSYIYSPGDRVRFIGWVDVVGGHSTTFRFTKAYDAEIVYQDEAFIYLPDIGETGYVTEMASKSHIMIELYTPNKLTPVEYLETIYWGDVLNPGLPTRAHEVPKYTTGTDQVVAAGVSTTPATFDILGNDYLIYQAFYWTDNGYPIIGRIEHPVMSPHSTSTSKGLGRVNFYNPDLKQSKETILRASNAYIPNTSVNGLSTFDYDDSVDVSPVYGGVKRLIVVGDVLKIVQDRKIGSMYIGGQVGTDAAGNQILLASDKILTDVRYGATDFGSMHRRSVVAHGSYLYGYDVINATAWRDTPGGAFDVANGMSSYFKAKTKALVASCGYDFKAIGTFDVTNKMYILTFIDPITPANNETIAFYEPEEIWYSFYSFLPDVYTSDSNGLYSFDGEDLYKHDSATRNTFYGTLYDSEVWIVFNEAPTEIKKFNSLSLQSNSIWYSDEILVDPDGIDYTNTESYLTHNSKMQSALPSAQFEHLEGEFVAEFLRDGLTLGTYQALALINGRPLQGKALLLKMKVTGTAAYSLRSVKVNEQIVKS